MPEFQIITWLIIICGWFFLNHFNNCREKRKEIRYLIDNIQTILDEIEKLAINYHTNQNTDELAQNTKLSFQLKRNLNQNLTGKLKILKVRKFNIGKSEIFRKQLRQAITLNNFDTSEFHPQPLYSEVIKDIWTAKDKFNQELEICFAKKY